MSPRDLLQPRRAGGLGVMVVVVVIAILIPSLTNTGSLFVWESALSAILFATSTNLLFGAAGIPSFGQAAFYGGGAYTVALLAPDGWNLLLILLAAVGVGMGLALGTAIFAWRTRGLVFAMLTLAVGQALYTLVIQVNTFGGDNGLYGADATSLFGINLYNAKNLWYLELIVAAIGMLILWVVWRSPYGRTLNAIREDGVRATFLGIDVRRYRASAFVIAGAMAGLAGALFAYTNQVVTPDQLYWSESATPIIMLLIGGLETFWGPAIGAVLLTWFLHFLSNHTTNTNIYLGIILMAVLVLLPRGLLSLPTVLRNLRTRLRGGGDDALAAAQLEGEPVVGLLSNANPGAGESPRS